MARGCTFKSVEAIGRTLPDVVVTTAWGQPTLKVHGRMFVCIAGNKSAEPNTLVVMMDFAARDALIADDSATYYLKDHYLTYPCVLVRLGRVRAEALRDLVIGAHRHVSATLPRRRERQRSSTRPAARRSKSRRA
ncbi:MAG: MmcQ/YjbR family DNA-binding protein [Vicinamibacterales bacterium]